MDSRIYLQYLYIKFFGTAPFGAVLILREFSVNVAGIFRKSLDKSENIVYNGRNNQRKEKNTEKMDGDGCISGDSKPPSTNFIILRRHSRCLFEWERRLCLFVLS